MGRPSDYTPEIAARICEELSNGRSLRSICEDETMPHESTVRHWAIEDREGFFTHYTRARDIGLDCRADKVVEDAHKATDASTGRLRFDAERWYLSKLAPKRYGDKVTNEHTGPDGGPVQASITVTFVKPEG